MGHTERLHPAQGEVLFFARRFPGIALLIMVNEEQHAIIDIGRYRRILIFFGQVIAHLVLWDVLGGRFPLLRSYVRRTRPERFRRLSRRFRLMAIKMGGVMIKLGQFLSARVDVLPLEITEELQGLQDEVPPEPASRIWSVLEEQLGDLDARFANIDEEPLAAASLGQVYRAWLLPTNDEVERGEAVVIKVQRPKIDEIVRTDLAALQVIARWTMRYPPIRRRANVPALLDEFARTLWEELDYEAEAGNAERFAEMYADDLTVYTPAVYQHHSKARVIVLEDVEAIKITDVDGMLAAGIDPKDVAVRLLDTYFGQIFQEGFFHADPHPGNLFVRPGSDLPSEQMGEGEPADGRPFWLIFVDFGMVGRVPDLLGENLRKVLISATQRDARQLVETFQDLGFFLPGVDLERLIEAEAVFLERMWGRNLLELARPDPREMRELGMEFRDILFDFPFQIPQDFIYLGRAVGMLSGLVSLLDPEINPWHHIEKFAEELVSRQEVGEFTVRTAWEFIRPYLTAPSQIRRLLDAAESGQLQVKSVPSRETLRHMQRLEGRLRQLSWSVLAAAGMVSATLWYLARKKNEGE
jgi:predicted unusual protein kinase regulating ubiquinone biosynthesis (AarF/ABC1/UbiB family)